MHAALWCSFKSQHVTSSRTTHDVSDAHYGIAREVPYTPSDWGMGYTLKIYIPSTSHHRVYTGELHVFAFGVSRVNIHTAHVPESRFNITLDVSTPSNSIKTLCTIRARAPETGECDTSRCCAAYESDLDSISQQIPRFDVDRRLIAALFAAVQRIDCTYSTVRICAAVASLAASPPPPCARRLAPPLCLRGCSFLYDIRRLKMYILRLRIAFPLNTRSETVPKIGITRVSVSNSCTTGAWIYRCFNCRCHIQRADTTFATLNPTSWILDLQHAAWHYV
jgi:hypothetical protein